MTGPMVPLAPILDDARMHTELNLWAAANAIISTVLPLTDDPVHQRLHRWHVTVSVCQESPDDEDAWNAEARAWRALQEVMGS